MKIEVGKTYKNGYGLSIKILSSGAYGFTGYVIYKGKHQGQPFCGGSPGFYTTAGKSYRGLLPPGEYNHANLIEEVEEE